MNDHTDFFRGLISGVCLSIPIWVLILWWIL